MKWIFGSTSPWMGDSRSANGSTRCGMRERANEFCCASSVWRRDFAAIGSRSAAVCSNCVSTLARVIACTAANEEQAGCCCCAAATNDNSERILKKPMSTGKTTKPASVPFRVADHLRNESEIAGFIEAALEDGNPRVLPRVLRSVADSLGGLGKLSERTGLSRETLYRTLSERGNPRYDTLYSILQAFGLRVSVVPQKPTRHSRSHRPAA